MIIFNTKKPEVFEKDTREKGKLGHWHVVILLYAKESAAGEAGISILRPYREGSTWLSWVDRWGNVWHTAKNEYGYASRWHILDVDARAFLTGIGVDHSKYGEKGDIL